MQRKRSTGRSIFSFCVANSFISLVFFFFFCFDGGNYVVTMDGSVRSGPARLTSAVT